MSRWAGASLEVFDFARLASGDPVAQLGGPVRMIHIGAADYIAITGCARQACASRRGLLLIREGGEELMARLDDGGFSHHHAYGPGVVGGAAVVLESALRALERASEGSPYPRPAP